MNGILISLSRTKQIHWHHWSGQETLITGVEAYQGRVLKDGSWHQETLETRKKHWGPHYLFQKEQRLWRRFLETYAIGDFQLRFQMRTVRFYGPPSKLVTLQPEWTVFLSLPGSNLGNLVVARTHVGLQPPSRRIMSDVRSLLTAPGYRKPIPNQSTVFIRGDLLLQFLSTALDYLKKSPGEAGEWRMDRTQTERGEPQPGGKDDEDDSALEYPPLLPANYSFIPRNPVPCSHEWNAIHYEPDQNKLVCFQPQSGTWADMTLEKPIFRHFKNLNFTETYRKIVIKGARHSMPDAVFKVEPK